MIDSAAAALGCAWPVDAGRRGQKGDSGSATDPFRAWRSGAAGRVQTGAVVVESIIYRSRRPGTVRNTQSQYGALIPKPRSSSWKWWRMCSSRSHLPSRLLGTWWCRA
jgi:hypothetical protein